MKKLLIGLCMALSMSCVIAEEAALEAQETCENSELIMPGPADRVVSTLDGVNVSNSWIDGSFIKTQNINCGLPPLPPLGCRVGPCVCDQTGRRCQWTFICG
jgi:hypothetical protein